VIEPTGDFTVYQGGPPDNPDKQKVWSTESSSRRGPNDMVGITFFPTDWMLERGEGGPRHMQVHAQNGRAHYLWQDNSWGTPNWKDATECVLTDEGSLQLRQNGQTLWNNGFSDPIVEYILDDCSYDTDHVTRSKPKDKGAMEQDLENNTELEQSMTMSKSLATSVTSSWSNTFGVKASISAKAAVKIPLVGSGEVTVSTEVSNAYTWGGSQSSTTTINISIPIRVPPHKKYRGYAFLQEVEIEVPYTMRGEFHFKSGRKVTQTIVGIYKGMNSYLGSYRVDDITDKKAPINVLQGDVLPSTPLLIRQVPDADVAAA
jgi:hypothetical protein